MQRARERERRTRSLFLLQRGLFLFNEGVQVPIVSEDVNNTICSQFLETSFEAKLEGFDVIPKDCYTSVRLMLLVY